MLKSSKFGSLSLEDLQEENLPGEGESNGEENVEVVEIFEPEEIEGDSASDAEVVEDAISEVEEVGEGLESLKEALSVSLADGGMNAQSAMFASLAYSGLTGKWVPAATDMPALESFETAGGRLQATTYAMESIGNTLKAWWEKLKALVGKWVEAVLSFWMKHASAAGKLAKASDALAKKTREYTGAGKKKEAEIELAAKEVVNLTSTHGEKVSEAEIVSGLQKLMAEVKRIGGEKALLQAVETMGQRVGAFKFDDEDAGKEIETLKLEAAVKAVEDTIGGKEGDHLGKKSSESVKFVASEAMFGNRVLLAKVVGDAKDQLESIEVALVEADKKAKHEAQKVEALDVKQIQALAKVISGIAGTVRDTKVDGGKQKQAINELKAGYDKAVKDLDKSNWSKEHKQQYNKAKALLSGYSKLAMAVLKPYNDIQTQAIVSARAAFNYAAKSYKNLEA